VDDAQIDAFVRRSVESAYHPCGTSRMGDPADPMTVVYPQARVVGLDGLRVVDSSIMPSITTGNLNAPTIMLAEKCADAILGRPPLAPFDAPFHVAPDWETSQR
jgi:choline dehydrogenase